MAQEEARRLLGDLYGEDHLTHEQIQELRLKVVTENGETIPPEETQGKVFRIEDPDEMSGYLVSSTESTGQSTVLSYLQKA